MYVGSGHEDNLRSPLSPLPILLLAPGCSWKCGGGSFNLYTANARNGGTLPTFLCRTAGTGGEARAGPRGAAHVLMTRYCVTFSPASVLFPVFILQYVDVRQEN